MNALEQEILNDPKQLTSVQVLLYKHQFSEEFLAKTVEYYDSWICLKTQQHLTPQFCFQYLYDNDTDSADNWTDFNDILRYFQKRWADRTKQDIEAELSAVFEESKKAKMFQYRKCQTGPAC